MTTSVIPVVAPTSSAVAGSWYWRRSTFASADASEVSAVGARVGSTRLPSSTMIRSVPTSRGSPASPNSKKPNERPPASAAASLTMMFTGVPVSASIEPAWALNASGMSIWLGAIRARTATTTTTGISAATAPFTLISAVSTATSNPTTTSSVVRFVPPRLITCWPAHAVTPVASSDSLTMKRAAMKITVGSPKPASAWLSVSTPVAQSRIATPSATTPIDTLFETKAMIASRRMRKVMATGVTGQA